MINFINSLIVYIFSFGVLGLLLYLPIRLKLLKTSKLLITGLVIMFVSLVFNVIYTGIMGWNYLPGSSLESLLDTIAFIVWMIGLVLYYVGLSKVNK